MYNFKLPLLQKGMDYGGKEENGGEGKIRRTGTGKVEGKGKWTSRHADAKNLATPLYLIRNTTTARRQPLAKPKFILYVLHVDDNAL
jgi:hypothetical protein